GIVPRNAALVHAPARRLADDQHARAGADAENRSRLLRKVFLAQAAGARFAADFQEQTAHPSIIGPYALAARRAVTARRPVRKERRPAARILQRAGTDPL